MTRSVQKQAEWLADKLASQDRKIANLASRGDLALSSIEDGAIQEKDLDGNLVATVGKQHDGSHVQVPYTGPKPAAPVAPSLKAVPGVVEVRWSGKFTGDAVSAMDFKHVAVHISTTPVVDTTPTTQVATIRGELGDVATVTAAEGMLYVALVAWSAAGKASDASPVASAAVPATADADVIGERLDDLDTKYDGVITDAGFLGSRLTAAEQDLEAAAGRIETAEQDITDAFGQITTVDTKATGAATAAAAAATAASTAQGKADTAKTAADQAAADALAASGIANSKGKTLIQSTAPAAADRNAVTLWIDTTGGANTPKRWTSGTTWVAVTDKAATDAATAAASAASAAAAAQSTASAAQTAAGNAQTTATSALTMAGTKGKVFYDAAAPSGTGTAPGDLWRQIDAAKNVTGEWYWTGSAWQSSQITTSAISNLDVGKLTAGAAVIDTLVSQKIAAAAGQFIELDVKQLRVTGTGTMNQAVIDKLWADVVNAYKITAQMVAIGSFDNLINEPDFTNGGSSWLMGSNRAIVQGQGRSAGPVLRLTGNAGIVSGYNLPQRRPVDGGTAWRLSAWVRPSVDVVAGSVWLFAAAFTAAGASTFINIAAPALTAGQWALVSGIVKSPDTTATASFAVSIRANYPTGATLDVDFMSCTRANAGELTVDGTVTARQMEAEMVLATKIVAGDPAATHAEMSPLGFKVFAAGVEGGSPTEVVRLGVASTDDYFAVSRADGTLVATISQDGVVVGDQINATSGLWYKGDELQTILDQMPKGLVGWAQRVTAAGVNANSSQRFPYLRVKVNVTAGRAYKISTTPIQANASNATTAAAIRLVYALGADAVPFDNTLTVATTADEGTGATWQSPITLSGMIYPQTTTSLSILIAFGASGDGVVGIQSTTSNPVGIFIEDVGRQVPQTGEALNGTVPPPPPVQNFVKQYGSNGSMNYQGSNAQYNWDTGNMYQGLSPAGMGNLKSISIHPSMTADLPGATINYVRVFFSFSHWYYNAGGTARIGLHGHASIPGSFSGNGVVATVGGWPRPGARWVDLPASTFSGFKSGAYKGVYLEGDSSYGTYGIAARPTIEIGYTK